MYASRYVCLSIIIGIFIDLFLPNVSSLCPIFIISPFFYRILLCLLFHFLSCLHQKAHHWKHHHLLRLCFFHILNLGFSSSGLRNLFFILLHFLPFNNIFIVGFFHLVHHVPHHHFVYRHLSFSTVPLSGH